MTKRLRSPSFSSDDETRTFEESATQSSSGGDEDRSPGSHGDGDRSPGSHGDGDEEHIVTDGRRIVGQVKWFNVKKGWGFIIGENGEDIFVHQSGVNKAGFRSLDDGEMVEYEIRNTDKGPEACKITGPQGSSVLGSQRRKRMRILQKQRKNRCFNCNVEGHIASSCPIPNTTKRCHVCLKEDHLMRQCPHQPLLLQQESLSPGLLGSSPPSLTPLSNLSSITTSPHLRAPVVTTPSGVSALTQPPPPSASLFSQIQLQAQLQQQLFQQSHLSTQLLGAGQAQQTQLLGAQQLSQLIPGHPTLAAPQLYYTLGAGAGQPFMYTYLPRFPPGPPI